MAGLASQHRKTGLIFSSVIGVIHTQIVSLGMLWCKVDIFATQKPSVVSNPRWVLLRAGGPVARRQSFLFNKQGEHTKQASREACCRAAVKPRPSSMSVERPPRPMDAMWGQGALPLVRAMRPVAEWRSFLFNKQGKHTRPASREARCRAAVTPQPSCFPTSTPAPYGRGVGCRGTAPARPQRAVRGAGLSPAGGRP